MNKKFIIPLLAVLLIVIGAVVYFGRQAETPLDTIIDEQPEAMTIEQAREVARTWVQTNSPTYTYDGSDLTLVTEEEIIPGFRYQFFFSFVSSAAGYGDRSDEIVAQVITPHNMEVIVENGQVVSAVTDEVYDELQGRMITDEPSDDSAAIDETPETLTISLYFVETVEGQEQTVEVEREIPYTITTGEAAIEQLLQGPTAQEQARGISSSIPEGTELQSIDIQDGVATVDFSQELDEGVAGSAWVTMIREQIEQTLMQFETVDEVVIRINGSEQDVLQP
ncbi:GerMN domain-containing protein [Candidatus Micrarchaeota archaeon]|jgi:hypothetical protein|nr:GerMN domain-containing protein [Candidatus Micrarchaeota archaeon]